MRLPPRAVALAGLARLCEPPVSAIVGSFVDGISPEEAWAAIAGRTAPTEVLAAVAPRLGSVAAADLEVRALDDLRIASDVGATIFGPGDRDWPGESFEPLQWVAPYDKCTHAWSPLALYRRGDSWPIRPRSGVAVVGSRAATPYGVRVATELSASAVDDGFTVISGAAFGIDAAAHRGALHGGAAHGGSAGLEQLTGATVAVLACGIDRAYPAAHRALIDMIAFDGSVVSEYPPGAVPARHRFLVRNRLIAAFAEVTVVVEAGRRSGSLNTATSAASLGRTVVAIPGPVTSAMSTGCHELIRDGKASLVASWADIRPLLGPIAAGANPNRIGTRATDGLDLVAARVYEALPARGGVVVDAIAVEAALHVNDVIGALAVLRTDGLVERRDGLWGRVPHPSGAPA
ncbi:MAG: DNA-processing protein DprA [Nakamurella sp.]